MKIPLWIPSEERKHQANITRFIREVNARYKLNIASYSDLYKWSVENIHDFWAQVWDFAEIKASKRYDGVVEDLSLFPGTKWFPGAKLNFAENLLRYRDEIGRASCRERGVGRGGGRSVKRRTHIDRL